MHILSDVLALHRKIAHLDLTVAICGAFVIFHTIVADIRVLIRHRGNTAAETVVRVIILHVDVVRIPVDVDPHGIVIQARVEIVVRHVIHDVHGISADCHDTAFPFQKRRRGIQPRIVHEIACDTTVCDAAEVDADVPMSYT